MSHNSTEHIYFGSVYSDQIISLRSLGNMSSLFLGGASKERVKKSSVFSLHGYAYVVMLCCSRW